MGISTNTNVRWKSLGHCKFDPQKWPWESTSKRGFCLLTGPILNFSGISITKLWPKYPGCFPLLHIDHVHFPKETVSLPEGRSLPGTPAAQSFWFWLQLPCQASRWDSPSNRATGTRTLRESIGMQLSTFYTWNIFERCIPGVLYEIT